MAEINWQFREHLGLFKGARLSVFTCLTLHLNTRNRTFIGHEAIMKETEYAAAPVSQAISFLMKRHAFINVPYAKRIGPERLLKPRKYVFQATGVFRLDDGTIIPYWHLKPESWLEIFNEVADLEGVEIKLSDFESLNFQILKVSKSESKVSTSLLRYLQNEIGASPNGTPNPPIRSKKTKTTTVPITLMTPMKNALAKAFGWGWQTMTDSEKSLIQKAARELCLAGLPPTEVQPLYDWCKGQGWSAFKPTALPLHLSNWLASTATEISAQNVREAQWD